MIKVDALTKYYGARAVVSDVSFSVKEGEILGFLGPNGAGKTTTMRILAGFMPATSGTASVAGYDVFAQSLDARRCVGYLPENVPMYPEMTVRSYLDYQATLRSVPRASRAARVRQVAERCRVDDVLDTRIGKLSKGYRQRVGLAQAIVHDPKVLILDEPTVGLDPNQISQTRALIKSLGGSHTIILSTHILPEVSMTCDRVAIINEGHLVAQDTPENLTRRLQGHDRVEVEVRGNLEEAAKVLARLPYVAGVEPVGVDGRHLLHVESAPGHDIRERVAAAVVQGGWGLLGLRRVTLSLEDVFLRLTTTEDGAAAEPETATPSTPRAERRSRKH